MKRENTIWTREQTIIALNLYCKIPFNRVSSNHPDIIRISKIIGRTPNSVKMKIGNFGSFDPELKKRGIVGLGNTSKLDEIVWNEFNNDWNNLAYESELLIAKLSNQPLENISEINTADIPIGKERETIIKSRINQNFFRRVVLSSYNNKCCITGLTISELLVASHIIPWSVDEKNRLNPSNGLCLNYLHDKAFDSGLITITSEFKTKVSKNIYKTKNDKAIETMFEKYDNIKIILPEKFLPGKEFLDYHSREIFEKKY